jgi:antitoxin component of MazEF toxin-antitoxin module
MAVQVNPTDSTVTATRSFRDSGSSVVVTIPPTVIGSLDIEVGQEVDITADWDTGEITLSPAGGSE